MRGAGGCYVNFRPDVLFSCKTQTDAADSKTKKKENLVPLIKNKKNQSFAGMQQQQQQLLKSICATHYCVSQQFIRKHETSPTGAFLLIMKIS